MLNQVNNTEWKFTKEQTSILLGIVAIPQSNAQTWRKRITNPTNKYHKFVCFELSWAIFFNAFLETKQLKS